MWEHTERIVNPPQKFILSEEILRQTKKRVRSILSVCEELAY